MLYPMDFTVDFWNERTSCRPRWQVGDGDQATLPTQFIREVDGHHVFVC